MRTDPCADCVQQLGLCQHHAPSILPQRAIPPWVWLIGEQHYSEPPKLAPAEQHAVERAKRREERKRSRRGLAGLLSHIATA